MIKSLATSLISIVQRVNLPYISGRELKMRKKLTR